MPTCPHPTCPCAHRNITAEALINHVQSSPWASLYFCATCKCVCKSETVLHHHQQKVHGINFASVPQAVPVQPPRASPSAACYCRVCNRSYTSKSALEQHYRDTPVHAKCARCNIGFVDDAALQAHVSSVHRPIASIAFSCRICDRAYTSASALEQHYRDTPVHPKCTRCNTGFQDNTAIQAHVGTVHRTITCWICDGMKVYEEDLDNHYKTSSTHPSCTICDVGFEDQEALNQHINASHPGFKCRTCNLPFASAALLGAHYRESPRHPTCPECQLSFEDNLALIQHTSLHDAFSDASIVSRASRSSSVARSISAPSIGAMAPTRSVTSPVSRLLRLISTPSRSHSPVLDSDPDTGIHEGFSPRSPRNLASSISPPSLVSRAPSASDQVILLDAFEERDSERNPESALPDVTADSGHSTPLPSAAGSIATRSVVAGASYRSETASPVSSAQSIFGRASSITSASRPLVSTSTSTFDVMPTVNGFGNVSPAKESPVRTALGRASPFLSGTTDTWRRGTPRSVSPSSIKTVSPPPSHVGYLSPGQGEHFRIAPASNSPRADSLPKSRESGRFHSPEPESPVRQPSPTKNIPKAEPTQMEKVFTPPTPTVVATYSNANLKPQTEQAPGERLVSFVYCRMCRRDPCRQPAATMCGHVFCYQCISSEVVKTSRCPVCEAPTLLYSVFKLHLV